MKFKEIKPDMVIHCPTEEDAKALYEHCGITYYPNTWDTHKSDTCYHLCGVKTIQSIGYGDDDYYQTRGFSIIEFSDIIEPETLSGKEVIEWLDKYSREIESMPELFPNCKTITDVVEWYTPECIMEKMVWYEKHKKDNADSPINSPTDSPMTAEELLEWLKKYREVENGILTALFGYDGLDLILDDYSPQEIVDKITAYEAAKKAPKPVEVEEGWRILVFDSHHNLWNGDYFYPGYASTKEEVESIAKRVAIDCVSQTGEDASWCVINACCKKEGAL